MASSSFRYTYEPIHEDFYDSAGWSMDGSAVALAPPADVFSVLIDASQWTQWFPRMNHCEWTSAPPVAIGSTREIRIQRRQLMEQEVIGFEPGVRLTFRYSRGHQQLAAAGMEEFLLFAEGARSCRVVWRTAIEAKSIARPMMRLGHVLTKFHPMGGLIKNQVPKALVRHVDARFGSGHRAT